MDSRRPKILYLTSHCPHAPSYGAQIRALHIGRLLQRCGEVQLALLRRVGADVPGLDQTREEFGDVQVLRCVPTPISGLQNRIRHELDPRFLNTDGKIPHVTDVPRLDALVTANDLVWVHGMLTANNVGREHWPCSVLDLDDVQSQFHRSVLTVETRWKERLLTARRLWLWKRREALLFKRFSILGVCSDNDRSYLGGGERIQTIPNGYGMNAVEPSRCPADPPRVGFIGTLKYPPNRRGVRWFVERVWPRIKEGCPAARLRMVGDQTDSDIAQLGPDIDGLGRVEDGAAEIATWSVNIVPVWIGGGTRIKIAESFSRKCPVVSSTWGAFGYNVTSGQELLLADEADAFAEACLSILRDPGYGEQLAARAWSKYVESWTWSAIGSTVEAAVENCLSLSGRQSAQPLPAGLQTAAR